MPIGGDKRKAASRLLAAEREQRALQLKLRGCTFEEIGRALGISTVGASKAYHRAFRRIPATEAKRAREEQKLRLDELRKKVWPVIDQSDRPMTIAAMSREIIRIEQREAYLFGLDAPEKLALEHVEDEETRRTRERFTRALQKLTPEEQATYAELLKKMEEVED
jgi:DNA-binding CsgD family transcriptional regulator